MRIRDCSKRPHVLVEVNLTSIRNITDSPDVDPSSTDESESPVSLSEILHRPSRAISVSGEEIGIVTIVLLLWIAAIALFINRWGKIRLMEPYHPYIRPESNPDPNSDESGGEGSRRMSANLRASMDGAVGVPPTRRKSIFPGPVTLEIPSTSPRNSLSASQIDRRKSVLDLWPGQSAAQLRHLYERRRSCLSDFSANRRESFYRGDSHAHPCKLSPLSCQYNSNRSVSLHPYFYLNSKTPPMLRYTPASTEKSDQSATPPPLAQEPDSGSPNTNNHLQEEENISDIQVHDEMESLVHKSGGKVITRQFSINVVIGGENDFERPNEEVNTSQTTHKECSETKSSKVSDV